MNSGFKIERYKSYRVRVRIRRGAQWLVKPGVERLDGREIDVEAWWVIGDESGLYEGEWAMGSDSLKPYGITWIASGDLDFGSVASG